MKTNPTKDLEPWDRNQDPEPYTMPKCKVLGTKDSQDKPGIDGHHESLAIYQGERVVLVFRHFMQLGLEPV